MLTVVCLRMGEKYATEYVDFLYRMVEQHLHVPHRFVCLVDDIEVNLNPAIERIEVDTPLHGWWQKLSLFRERPYGIEGTILFMDLDTVVVDNLDPLLEVPGELVMIQDFMRPARWNSSVFRLTAGSRTKVWHSFDFRAHGLQFHGDQEWIAHTLVSEPPGCVNVWPDGWCVSYRLQAQKEVPAGARVVCFHGEPKPHTCGGWVPALWRGTPPRGAVVTSGGLELETHTWRGQLRYHCPECPFDSHTVANVVIHWKQSHDKKPAASPGPTLFDADGRPIERRIDASELPNF